YAPESKGYIVWVPSSRTVKVRRDITFLGPPTQPLSQGGVNLQNYAPLWEPCDPGLLDLDGSGNEMTSVEDTITRDNNSLAQNGMEITLQKEDKAPPRQTEEDG